MCIRRRESHLFHVKDLDGRAVDVRVDVRQRVHGCAERARVGVGVGVARAALAMAMAVGDECVSHDVM